MQKILGIDYGSKNIGLAIGSNGVTQPLEILPYKKDHQLEMDAIEKIRNYIEDEHMEDVVIGIPYINGEEGDSASDIRRFGNLIKNGCKVHVHYIDESRTSKEGREVLLSEDVPKKKRKDDHASAASIIIKRYWEDAYPPK